MDNIILSRLLQHVYLNPVNPSLLFALDTQSSTESSPARWSLRSPRSHANCAPLPSSCESSERNFLCKGKSPWSSINTNCMAALLSLGRDRNVINHDGFSSVVREPFLSTFTPRQPPNAQSPACILTAFSQFLRGSLKSHLITVLRKPLRAIQCHRARIRQEGCWIRSSGPEDIRTMSEGHRDLHNKGQCE